MHLTWNLHILISIFSSNLRKILWSALVQMAADTDNNIAMLSSSKFDDEYFHLTEVHYI